MLHKSTGATRTIRSLISVLAVCALAGSASPAHAAPLASGLAAATAELDVITNGNGTVTVSPSLTPVECTPTGGPLPPCERREYAVGQSVTLMAKPDAGTDFVGWSDGRCPAADTCSLPLDADRQAVTALFSKKHVWVRTVLNSGNETVTADDQPCTTPTPDGSGVDCGDFDLTSRVKLTAHPDQDEPFQWNGSLCDPPVPNTQPDCTMNVLESRIWASVGFGPGQSADGTPPTVSVRFRVLKQGSGSGRVSGGVSGGVDCGNSCVTEQDFGTRQNLTANPDQGSTFRGWRGACGSAPNCSLAVGPVTAVVAVFDAAGSSQSPSSGSQPSSSSPPSRPATRFAARFRRFVVSGHGRKRRILIRVQVNAPATCRATLTSRRGRRVTSKRWRLAAGSPLLRLKVPTRTRRGTYRLALSLSDGRGHVVRVTRRVRIPR